MVEWIINLGAPHRVYRDGRVERFKRAWIAGTQRGPLTIGDEDGAELVGIRFRPGGARA